MIYLISFLGATPWDKLRYQLNLSNDHYIESDYATFALKELLGMMNSEYKKLRIILFGTHASNWRVAEKYFGDNFTKIIIPEVKNNKESAELFKLIIQEIPEGELILDLTHGYRHLPIFLLLSSFMLELIDSNKHKIIHAFYALRSREEKTAKFISINNYLTFLDSIFATELFRKSLHTERLDAITRELETTKQTGEYEEKKFHYLIDALKGIRKFGEELKTGNIREAILLAKDVYQQINNAKSALESSFPYLIPILEEYSDEVKLIQEQRAKPLWQVISTLANIFLGKELFLTSMLLLRESLITYACHYFSLCSDKSYQRFS